MTLTPTPPTFDIRYRPRNTPPAALIADLRRVAREAAGARRLTITLYGEKGRFGTNTVLRAFGSWNAALAAAGLPIAVFWRVPDRALFENIATVWHALGRQPTGREMAKDEGLSLFALSTYKKRFGSWHNALRGFAAFVDSGRRTGGVPARSKSKIAAAPRGRARAINWRLRATVLIRDNCLCRMCGASPAKDPAVTLHVDHVVPWSKGGATRLDNLQTLCAACNIGKSDRAGPTLLGARHSSGAHVMTKKERHWSGALPAKRHAHSHPGYHCSAVLLLRWRISKNRDMVTLPQRTSTDRHDVDR